MTGPMAVLGFPEYLPAARALAAELGTTCECAEVHRFPDGERRVRVPLPAAPHTVLCRSLFEPDHKLIELMLAAAALRDRGVDRLTLVAPYLCYMRQDTAFRPGEAVSQRVIGRFLAQQFDTLITVDPHLHRIRRLPVAVPARQALALSAAQPIGAFLRARVENPILVGPDSESEQWVRTVAEAAGLEFAVAAKHRLGDQAVELRLPERDFAGREVVLVDDVASSGRTLAAAAARLSQAGAENVRALVTHALFAGDAEEHICAAGVTEIWSTDSIPHSSNRVALAPLLAAELR